MLRHEGNQKWYAVLMKIFWDKLEKGREGQVEAVNLKHDQVADLLSHKGVYPAFHMNKRYWISVALDDTLSDKEVLEFIEKSWNLTTKKWNISMVFKNFQLAKYSLLKKFSENIEFFSWQVLLPMLKY